MYRFTRSLRPKGLCARMFVMTVSETEPCFCLFILPYYHYDCKKFQNITPALITLVRW